MKKYTVETKNKPTALEIKVKTFKPELIGFTVENFNKKDTVYINTFVEVDGEYTAILNLPQNCETSLVSIWKKSNPNDNNFEVLKLDLTPIKRKYNGLDFRQKGTKEFVKFIQEFSENAGILSGGGSVYASDNGEYKIMLSDKIVDGRGNIMSTPARINSETKLMEFSKPAIQKMTVYGRVGLGCHEYSHVFENVDADDEVEADANAIKIMLGLGYPKIEIYNVWLEVFKLAPTNQNVQRYQELKKLINEYR